MLPACLVFCRKPHTCDIIAGTVWKSLGTPWQLQAKEGWVAMQSRVNRHPVEAQESRHPTEQELGRQGARGIQEPQRGVRALPDHTGLPLFPTMCPRPHRIQQGLEKW